MIKEVSESIQRDVVELKGIEDMLQWRIPRNLAVMSKERNPKENEISTDTS